MSELGGRDGARRANDGAHEKGRLVVITGLPGSGKTALAAELAMSLPAVRMCPDDWMASAGIDLWGSRARARISTLDLDALVVSMGLRRPSSP